jgi:hypothetical protein
MIKNNNIVMEFNTAYPIRLGNFDTSQYDIDYNNMYAPKSVGYVEGSAKTTIAAWQEVVTTDKHSVSIYPDLIDNTLGLELLYNSALECPPLQDVPMDINNDTRLNITTMGCYQVNSGYLVNGRLTKIREGKSGYAGLIDTIQVILTNASLSPLTQATLNWSFNGVLQSPTTIIWQDSLTMGEFDTITLGIVTHTVQEEYVIKAWISALGTLQDEFSEDDTVQIFGFICPSLYSGNYTVGTSGYFTSIKEALDKLQFCGVTGNVVLELLSGIYLEDVYLTKISSYMGNHTLTLTSQTGKSSDVIIRTAID